MQRKIVISKIELESYTHCKYSEISILSSSCRQQKVYKIEIIIKIEMIYLLLVSEGTQ